MNHVASAIPPRIARAQAWLVKLRARRGRQIDGGERVRQKGKGRNERKRETNWKSPGKGTGVSAGATSEAIGEQ